jgi:hypothetical protein
MGAFSPAATCALVSGSGMVSFKTSRSAYAHVVITASYAGDGVHEASSAAQTIPIIVVDGGD